MLKRLRSLVRGPTPAGPPETIRRFEPYDHPITESGLSPDDGGWRIEARAAGSVRLFEVAPPAIDQCVLTYRAELRTVDVAGAYLEMWCRVPGRGEFFSKGLNEKAMGTTGWSSYEIPFYLKAGQRPDLIRLNVALDGPGDVWLRKIELLRTPLR